MTRHSCGVAAGKHSRHLFAVCAIIAGCVLLLCLTSCVHTREFRDAQGRVIPGSIATMEFVTINGVQQSIWFRGVDRNHPALIILSGGPGVSEAALFRHYNSALEQHFLVVYWEQRGAGRSYHSGISAESMTIAQFLRDLDRVVDLVRQRLGKPKVVLLAHSWGTILGTIYAYRHPEKVSTYVGIAQIADMQAQARRSCQFALFEARKRGNEDAIGELRTICPLPNSVDEELTLGDWVARFGGTFYGDPSKGDLIWAALSTEEANLIDIIKFGQGNRFSLEALRDEYAAVDLTRYQCFKVPVFFLLGRHDWHVPSVLAAQYFEKIQAPYKQLVWFERSGHNPPFSEPSKFSQTIILGVLPLVAGVRNVERQATCESSNSVRDFPSTATRFDFSAVYGRSGGTELKRSPTQPAVAEAATAVSCSSSRCSCCWCGQTQAGIGRASLASATMVSI